MAKIEINTIIQGDCLEVMKDIENKSIDMILCDLPYGTSDCKWDTVITFKPLWEQYRRIIKDNGAIVLTAIQPFTSALVMSNINMFKYEWIWEKAVGSNFATVKYQPMKEHENICIFGKGRINYHPIMQPRKGICEGKIPDYTNTKSKCIGLKTEVYKSLPSNRDGKVYTELRNPSSVQKFNNRVPTDRNFHSTQKPVALFEYLIKTYTNEGDLVLDNCAGSGTTGVACLNTKRNYILIELEKKYCNIIEKRLKDTNGKLK